MVIHDLQAVLPQRRQRAKDISCRHCLEQTDARPCGILRSAIYSGMFDFRKIEAFCKVCELRSFSKAGEALFLSQPTVSAHIQALERLFEVRLLDRMGRTVLPTPAGMVLYNYARQAFAILESAREDIQAMDREVKGELVVGSSGIPAHHILPDALAAFIENYPRMNPKLVIASSAAIVSQVREGKLMAGIVGGFPKADTELAASLLLESEIVLIAPSTLQPAGAGREKDPEPLPEISFKNACRLNWIMREESSTTREIFRKALHEAGYDERLLNVRMTVDSSHAAVQYVRAGLGVSAAVRIAAVDALDRGEVQAFHIAGVRAVRQFWHISNARRMSFPPAVLFLELLRERTKHLRPAEQTGP